MTTRQKIKVLLAHSGAIALSLLSIESFAGTCAVYSITDYNTVSDRRAVETSTTNQFNKIVAGDVAYSGKINQYGAVLDMTDLKTGVSVSSSVDSRGSERTARRMPACRRIARQ